MGKHSPKAPDMTAYAQASERAAELSYQASQDQLAWAREMWGEQKTLLEQVLGPQLEIMKAQYDAGMKDRARYEQLYQPLEENLVREFQSYDTPERRASRAGAAQAQVAIAQRAQRENTMARLEGYGIDPSQTRSAALDRGLAADEAAQQAAAGNIERNNVENIGRALRAEAINIGRGYPSQVAGAYGQTLTAGNSAVGNMNSTVGTGAGTMGTGLQWGAQGLNATNSAANITNQGFRNELAAFEAQGSPWELAAQVGGAWAGSGFRRPWGGARGGAIEADAEVGEPRPPAPRDTVRARVVGSEDGVMLQPGEGIVPKVVREYYGQKFFDNLTTKALEAMGIDENDLGTPREDQRIEHPHNSREVRRAIG